MRKLTNFNQLKYNDRFIIVSNSNSHSYPLNKQFTFRPVVGPSSTQAAAIANEVTNGSTVNINDVRLLTNYTIQELLDIKEEYLTKIKSIDEKLDFCKEHKLDNYDFELDKTLSVMKQLKIKDPKKAKEVIDILKKELYID